MARSSSTGSVSARAGDAVGGGGGGVPVPMEGGPGGTLPGAPGGGGGATLPRERAGSGQAVSFRLALLCSEKCSNAAMATPRIPMPMAALPGRIPVFGFARLPMDEFSEPLRSPPSSFAASIIAVSLFALVRVESTVTNGTPARSTGPL